MLFKRIHGIVILLSALSGVAAFYAENSTLYYVLKPLTTILIILFALIHGYKPEKQSLKTMIFALLFCLLGDVLLMKESFFVFGLGAFLIAQVLISLSFVRVDGFKNYFKPFILLILIGGGFYSFLYPSLNELAIPVLVYVICILVMVWQGIGLYVWKKKKPFFIIMAGAILFMISDCIIALNKFVYSFDMSQLLVLTTYWMAIFLLAKSATLKKKGL